MKYYLRNKNYNTYYKSRYQKGLFHYVSDINNATSLTKVQAVKLLNELKNKENFEIVKRK